MNSHRFLKRISAVALGLVLIGCSGCSAYSSEFASGISFGTMFGKVTEFLRDCDAVQDSQETQEQIQANNAQNSYFKGYSYVDFSEVDTALTFAGTDSQENSVLGNPGYCYGTLSQAEQVIYEEIYAVLLEFGDSRKLSTTDSDLVQSVYNQVMADHPEIFWTEGYTINTTSQGDRVISLEFSMKQAMEESEVRSWQQTIAAYLQEFSQSAQEAGIDEDSDDYDRIKFTFDYIVTHTEYEKGVENNQNICSVFGSGYSVCQGYSVAMQYLLQYQGIESVTVSGSTNDTGTSHAWNLVKADGDWYYLDVTWGDPSFSEEEGIAQNVNMVNYTYFCVTDQEISVTHTAGNGLELPECSAVSNNYYVHENHLFEQWNQEQLEDILTACMEEGKAYASIRFQDEEQYQEALEELISDQRIFDLLNAAARRTGTESATRLSYYEEESFCIVTFMWE